jgi:hypothetical protein
MKRDPLDALTPLAYFIAALAVAYLVVRVALPLAGIR